MTRAGSTTPGAGAGASAAETPDEADLIRRSQAGDKEAFGAIVKRYAGAATVVSLRFATSEIMNGAAELLAYGTAVKLE